MLGKPVFINIVEVKNPDVNATLVAENIAAQLEKRISFRRAMKLAMGRAMRLGAKGIKPRFPAVSAVPKLLVPSIIMRVPFRCKPFVPILTTVLQRLTPLTAALA